MVPLATQLSMTAPELLLFLCYGISLLDDNVLVSVWTKSLLADELVIDTCNLAHVLVHAVKMLSSPIDIQKDFSMLWLGDCWEDPHEFSIILGDDVLLEVFSFSIDAI